MSVSKLSLLPPEILMGIYQWLDLCSKARMLYVLEGLDSVLTLRDLEFSDKSGNTIFHSLAREGYSQILQSLIGRGLCSSKANCVGETVLHLAVDRGHEAAARVLLDAIGLSLINIQDEAGRSPLHYAAMSGRPQLVSLLIERGADVSASDVDGSSILQYAVVNGEPTNVRLLLRHGADRYHPDRNGLAPIHWSALTRNGEIARLFLDSPSAQSLINLTDSNGLIPLHHAAYWGNCEMAGILLSKGSNPNKQTLAGWTPLHHAVQGAKLDMIKLLLRHGAMVDIGELGGMTPLHLSTMMKDEQIVRILSNNGVDILPRDSDHYSPTDYAAFYQRYCNPEMGN